VKKTINNPVSNAAGLSRCGFTLPEVLIAVVILATGIVAVLQAFSVSLSVLGESRNLLKANMLIMEKMADMEVSAITRGEVEDGSTSGSFNGENSSFRWDIKVDRVSGGVAAGAGSNTLNQIDITVWRDGSQRRYTASTYLVTEKKQ